jgi:hypothetical protein
MAKIEITVNRTSDETGVTSSSTIGIISFDESDPSKVVAPNPLDFKSLIVLKKFVDGQLEEAEKLKKGK